MIDNDKPSIMTITYVFLGYNKDAANFTNDNKNNSYAANFTNDNKNNSNTANGNTDYDYKNNTNADGNSTSSGSRYCMTDLQSIMADQGAQEFGNGVN